MHYFSRWKFDVYDIGLLKIIDLITVQRNDKKCFFLNTTTCILCIVLTFHNHPRKICENNRCFTWTFTSATEPDRYCIYTMQFSSFLYTAKKLIISSNTVRNKTNFNSGKWWYLSELRWFQLSRGYCAVIKIKFEVFVYKNYQK